MSAPIAHCSAVVILAKERFASEIQHLLEPKFPKHSSEIYFPEEDPIWLIPSIGSFKCSEDFDNYISAKKEEWLVHTFAQFGIPVPVDSNFDFYFDLLIRDNVFDARNTAQQDAAANP